MNVIRNAVGCLAVGSLAACADAPASGPAPSSEEAVSQSLATPLPYVLDVLQCGTGVHGCQGTTLGDPSCPDDSDAIQRCLNENQSAHIYFPKVRLATPTGHNYPDFYLTKAIVPCGSDQRLDGSTGTQSGGTILEFASGSAGIKIQKNTTSPPGSALPCPWTIAPKGVRIENLSLYGDAPAPGTQIIGAIGILIQAPYATLDNLSVFYFGDHGVEIDSGSVGGLNADAFALRHLLLEGNRGDGLYVHGHDSNVGVATDVSLTNNGGWGVEDESYLGNTYVQPHAAVNGLGAYKSTGLVSNNLFLNPYAEQGQPPSQIIGQSLVVGGVPQAFDWSKHPSVIQTTQNSGLVSSPTRYDAHNLGGAIDPISLQTNGFGHNDPLGGFVVQNQIRNTPEIDSITFRRTADGVSGTAGPWGELDNGWWGFRTAQIVDGGGLANYPFLMSDPLTSVGAGWGWFPNGFYLGQKNVAWSARRKISVAPAVPPNTEGELGDIVLFTNPVAGGSIGWVKATGGSWVAFGPVGESTTSALTTSGTVSAFFPGALTSAWTGLTWTPDKPIKITRVQAQAKTPPSACGTAATVRITDGTTSVTTAITASANTTSGIAQAFAAGTPLTVDVGTAASGCAAPPADLNVVITYQMSQ